MILLIDNYDSFAHNLARYLVRLDQQVQIVRNDELSPAGVRDLNPAAIVISPGPCTPVEAGNSLAIVRELHSQFPMLGVCLGHQVIAAALGGRIVRSPKPFHGQSSELVHEARGLFAGLPVPMHVGRYHSLVADVQTLPTCLQVTARTDDGILMAFEHTHRPVFGVQFHPESILTVGGYLLLNNFLHAAGLASTANPAKLQASELRAAPSSDPVLPRRPVTF